ncbi:MAG: DUF3597 domain-containing protein, partial [Ramlibacter sp.]|nr:DUF3597 domain-containing protein [Ramlibacter sp.]
MGILSNIFSKIFPSSHAANAPAVPTASPAGSTATATASTTAPAPAAPVAMAEVDVEQMLDGMAAKSTEKLNWKTSIVDLMNLLGLDSSLTSRKLLASELRYTGDMNDSAAMNI